jgi:hypothetical protein
VSVEHVSAQLSEYLQLFRSQWQQQLQLLALETQRAAESLVAIWLLSLFAALLLLSSWVLLLLLLWSGTQVLGLYPWQGLLLLIGFQCLALWFCLLRIRFYSQYLRFPATQLSWAQTVTTQETTACPTTQT